jgi:hypothetical protein
LLLKGASWKLTANLLLEILWVKKEKEGQYLFLLAEGPSLNIRMLELGFYDSQLFNRAEISRLQDKPAF